jgi:hypothetical protein
MGFHVGGDSAAVRAQLWLLRPVEKARGGSYHRCAFLPIHPAVPSRSLWYLGSRICVFTFYYAWGRQLRFFGGINSRSRQGLVDLIKRYISPEPAPWYFWRRVASTRYFLVSLFVFACFGACEALKVSCSRTTLSSDKRGHKYLAHVLCMEP